MSRTNKRNILWKIWNEGLTTASDITEDNRSRSLIPINFMCFEKEYIMRSDLGEVILSAAEISEYGVIKNDLYRYFISKLLKNEYKIDFETPTHTKKIKYGKIAVNSSWNLTEMQIEQVKQIREKSTPLVFVNGKEKVGKTNVIKKYCEQFSERGEIAYFLDFNCGYFDFCDFIDQFSRLPKDTTKQYVIFLDHLYCCDMETAEKILGFFNELIDVLEKSKIRLKVIVSETPDTIFSKSDRVNTITMDISNKSIQDIMLSECSMNHRNAMEDHGLCCEKLFEKVVSDNSFASEELVLFHKILTLSSAGFQIILDNSEEKKILLKEGGLLNKINGLTVYKNIFNRNSYIVSFFKFDIARLILEYLENNYSVQRGFDDKKDICSRYLSNYYDIATLIPILENQSSINIYSNEESSSFLQDYLYLIQYCINKKEEIVKVVRSSPDDEILGNHLGKILFALETIVGVKTKSWEDQRAVIKIKKLVRNMYFISKEVALPNINYQYINKEKTVEDFFSDKDQDSIRTQVELQDKLLTDYSFDEKRATSTPESTEQFAYYLSKLQLKYRYIDNYMEFFQTYILALLLEFESTMLDIDPDKERLDMLLERVFQAAKYNKDPRDDSEADDNYCYFYPARVPWVTGRMYLAINCFLERKDHVQANKLKLKMERWLKKVSHEIALNGKRCCIWCSGTGNWNTVLDTTIMCMSAMRYREGECFNKAKEYILAREQDWLTSNNLTSGISALEILSDTMRSESIHELKKRITNLVENKHETAMENKSDGAMGDSQIAQKLVDLCIKYRTHAITALSNKLYLEKEERGIKMGKKHFKIGVTFSGKYRNEYIEPMCEQLLKLGYSKDDIFYDYWHEELINGPEGDIKLSDIYLNRCECIVVLISPDYSEKNWTGNIEWPAVLELINEGRGDQICLLKVGNASIRGLQKYRAITKSIDKMSPLDVAEFVDKKYKECQNIIE